MGITSKQTYIPSRTMSDEAENQLAEIKKTSPKIFEERGIKAILGFFGIFAIITLLIIIFFLIRQSSGWLKNHTMSELIFGLKWSPSSEGGHHYGAASMIFGTVAVTALSMLFAIPFGLGGAIFIAEVAPHKLRLILKSLVEILSGIPSIVYGYFGLQFLSSFIADLAGPDVHSGSTWLTASILLAIMAQPTIISVAEDAISSVPQEYKEASLGCGATKWQTISKVTVPSASSGIAAAIILGTGRVIGETMAVMMVAGGSAQIPNPWWDVLTSVRTITYNLGAQMAEAVAYKDWLNALWMLGVILMVFTIVINAISRRILQKMNEKFNPPVQKDDCVEELVPKNKVEDFFFKIRNKISEIQFKWATWKKKYKMSRENKLIVKKIIKISLSVAFAVLLSFGFGFLRTIILVGGLVGIIYVYRKLDRKNQQKIAFLILTITISIVIFCLGVIIFEIFKIGLPVMSWEFLTTEMENNAAGGGIIAQISGTLWLTLYTMMIALPFGIGAGIYLAEYTNDQTFISKAIHAAIDLLNGLPSIIFGMFGYLVFRVLLGMGVSLISGALILSLMILPVLIRTTEEAIKAVPQELREASYAMGATKWETIKTVVLPTAKPSVITGIVLSVGRVVGETAPIMFIAVAFEIPFYPLANPLLAVQTLSYHLYGVWSEYPDALPYAGGTALTLLLLVLVIFTIANIMRYKYQKELKK